MCLLSLRVRVAHLPPGVDSGGWRGGCQASQLALAGKTQKIRYLNIINLKVILFKICSAVCHKHKIFKVFYKGYLNAWKRNLTKGRF